MIIKALINHILLLFLAKVALPGCNGSDANSFSYTWELTDSSGDAADLGANTDKTKPYLKLDGSNLKGGEVRKCSNV